MVCDACLRTSRSGPFGSSLVLEFVFADWRQLPWSLYHATNEELIKAIGYLSFAGLGTRVPWVCLAFCSYLTSAKISGCSVTAVWTKALYPFSWRTCLQRMCAEVPGALIDPCKNGQAQAWAETKELEPLLFSCFTSNVCSPLAPSLCREGKVFLHSLGAKKSACIYMEQLDCNFFFLRTNTMSNKKQNTPQLKNENAWARCPPWQFKQSALDFRVEFPRQSKRWGAGRKRLSLPLACQLDEHVMEQDADVLDAAWLHQSALCSMADIAEKLRAAWNLQIQEEVLEHQNCFWESGRQDTLFLNKKETDHQAFYHSWEC